MVGSCNRQLPGLGDAVDHARAVELGPPAARRPGSCSRWPAPNGARTPPNAPATTVAATAGGALPDGRGDAPSPTAAPVTFVAEGRAWATTPTAAPVVPVRGAPAGPFLWGPRGDRVVLDGLEVRGVGCAGWRPARGIETVSLAWLGANGNALAFVMPGGLNPTSAVLGSIDLRELTPFRGG